MTLIEDISRYWGVLPTIALTIAGQRWTVATDARVAVMVPGDIGGGIENTKISDAILRMLRDRAGVAIQVSLPRLRDWCGCKPEAPCSRCAGTGYVVCQECRGTGEEKCVCPRCDDAHYSDCVHCASGKNRCCCCMDGVLGWDPEVTEGRLVGYWIDRVKLAQVLCGLGGEKCEVSPPAGPDQPLILECADPPWIVLLITVQRTTSPREGDEFQP